jgi:hypothetical protein
MMSEREKVAKWLEDFEYESSRLGVGRRRLPPHVQRTLLERLPELLALIAGDAEPVGLVAQVNAAVAILENGTDYERMHVSAILRDGLGYLNPQRERDSEAIERLRTYANSADEVADDLRKRLAPWEHDHEAMEKLRALGCGWEWDGETLHTLADPSGGRHGYDNPADAILASEEQSDD